MLPRCPAVQQTYSRGLFELKKRLHCSQRKAVHCAMATRQGGLKAYDPPTIPGLLNSDSVTECGIEVSATRNKSVSDSVASVPVQKAGSDVERDASDGDADEGEQLLYQ